MQDTSIFKDTTGTNFKARLYDFMQSIMTWYASSFFIFGLSMTKSEPRMHPILYLFRKNITYLLRISVDTL